MIFCILILNTTHPYIEGHCSTHRKQSEPYMDIHHARQQRQGMGEGESDQRQAASDLDAERPPRGTGRKEGRKQGTEEGRHASPRFSRLADRGRSNTCCLNTHHASKSTAAASIHTLSSCSSPGTRTRIEAGSRALLHHIEYDSYWQQQKSTSALNEVQLVWAPGASTRATRDIMQQV